MAQDKQGIDIHTIIIEAKNGNFDAFRQIVLQYSNAMLSVAFSIIGDFHEAQDAAQEAFMKCYRRLHTLDNPSKLANKSRFRKKEKTNLALRRCDFPLY